MRVKIKKLLLCGGVFQLSFAVFLWYTASTHQGQNLVINTRIGEALFDRILFNVTNKIRPLTKTVTQVVPVKLTIESKCSNITLPLHLATGNTWLPVDNVNNSYVFSAYFSSTSKTVTVIGMREERHSPGTMCQLWFYSDDRKTLTMNETSCMPHGVSEGHGRRYGRTLYFPRKKLMA